MRLRSHFFTTIVFLGFALLLVAGVGKAENPGGKFTLPYAATWGSTVLPPGDYTFTVISPLGSLRYLDVRGKKTGAYILPARTETGTDASHSHLTLVAIGVNHFIEKLSLKEANLTFEFRLPKGAKTEAQFTHLMLSHVGQGS